MRTTLLSGLLALLIALPTLAADGPRWCSSAVTVVEASGDGNTPATPKTVGAGGRAQAPTPLERISVRWELDLRGAVATGTLIETYLGDSSAASQVQYRVYPAPGFEVVQTRVVIDGAETELETAAPVLEPDPRRRRARKPSPGVEHSQSFEVPSGSLVEMRISVQGQLGFKDGWLELELPIVTRDCRRSGVREKKGERETGIPLEVALLVHHPSGGIELSSETHPVSEWGESHGTSVELSGPALVDEGPFILRYRLESEDEDESSFTGWVSEQRDDGTRDLLVVLTPPQVAAVESVGRTDAVFVLDTSGSMKGKKIASLRDGVAGALELLDVNDSFSLIRFADASTSFSPGLSRADGYERSTAKNWLASLEAAGSTRLTEALIEAIGVASSGESHPVVVVITDGAIQDVDAVEKILGNEDLDARVLFLGLGAEPQVAILQRLAVLSRGEAAFAREATELKSALSRLFGSFSSPLAWDLRLEAPGAEIVATWPKRVPDLYEGRPVTLFLRVRGDLPETLRLRGASVAGDLGLDRSLRIEDLPEAPGLRGPRALDAGKRRRR